MSPDRSERERRLMASITERDDAIKARAEVLDNARRRNLARHERIVVGDAEHAALDAAWRQAFDALRTAGLRADSDDPVAVHYRAASNAVNHANRSRDFANASSPVRPARRRCCCSSPFRG